ncbi:hypothetical protein DD237_008322 [Peronospora effusa]|uniref:Protein-lysine N-methyltransferase n=1 Tax=Peronospora effusa TaxID=542832 RepID=A0A425BVS6_9STRA|nr:hypothetical protein DD237_008322 [Peronospora effusa]
MLYICNSTKKQHVYQPNKHSNQHTMDELLMTELSAETLAALQAHLLEQHQQDEDAPVSEDFRLSQFWYDEKTGRALAQEAIDHSSNELKIAFVSTPAAYRDFLKIQSEEKDEAKRAVMGDNVYLFEFDRRFGEKYGDHFCFYDYNAPTNLPEKFHHFFDYVLMEPPHLSLDCLAKFSDTMRWIAKDVELVPGKKDRVINPTTFINSQLLRKEMKADLGFTPTGFYPSFESKLSNHLLTYTNYESQRELSADTLAALQAHLQEQQVQQDAGVSEDFRLSQFWYDNRTGRALAQEAIDQSKENCIAFVSTPAAYRYFLKIQEESESSIDGDNVYLFEYDRRFGEKYNDHFVFYDYNESTNLPEKFHRFFDYVLVDPPYLNINCMSKFAETMRWLVKDVEVVPGSKHKILNPCTFITARMLRKDIFADLNFTPSGFTPTFESKLSNQFLTYTNYVSDRFGESTENFEDSDNEK